MMMVRLRLALAASLSVAAPVLAWEAGLDGPVCTLEHVADGAEVRLTYDPALPLYTIAIRRAEPWPAAPAFSIRYEGRRPITISTARHVLSADGRTLTVADRGFGNVLDGLQFNDRAVAFAGEVEVPLGLDGAAPEVAAFRACATAPSA
jgi:hypothetical protein